MTPAEISAHVVSLSLEDVNREIALRRGLRITRTGLRCKRCGQEDFIDCRGGDFHQKNLEACGPILADDDPPDYCGSWEHAGPLLDEMPHARMDPLGEEPGFRVCWDAYGHMGGHHDVKGHPCCSTRTEAISRAWLIANWERT